MQLVKDQANNIGNYVLGSPAGDFVQIPTVWGLPVVRSNSISSGRFLVGNSRYAAVAERDVFELRPAAPLEPGEYALAATAPGQRWLVEAYEFAVR